jgi:uncharacterized membrane protein YoaK (UPF0700 family)
MTKTRLSLYYLAGYLIPAGLALMFVPGFALKLLFSNGNYGEFFPRLTGVVLFALGILIAQIIRHKVEALYSTTVIVRVAILSMLLFLYFSSHDPFFVVIAGVVGLGMILTGTAYLSERGKQSK